MRTFQTAVIILCALSLFVAACSSDATLNRANEDPQDEITLTMMHLWPEETSPAQYYAIQRIINEYTRAHPHIHIETEVLDNDLYKQKLKVLSTSNEQPDIGFSWSAGFLEPYISGQRFAPLNDLLNHELKDMFIEGTTEPFSMNGNTYALPFELHLVPIYYNKAIFEKYDLTPPETLDDFKAIITVLNEFDVTPIGLGGKDPWTSSFWYMYLADRIGGPKLLDEAVSGNNFQHPDLIKAAAAIQELVDMNAFQRGFNGLSYDEAKTDFIAGKTAMYATGTWEVPNFTINSEIPQEFRDQVGYFKFPAVEGGKGDRNNWVGGVGVGVFVSERSKYKEEAKQFVTYFIKKWGEISVTAVGIIPGTKVNRDSIAMPKLFLDLLGELYEANKITLYLDVQMRPVAAVEHQNLVQALFGKAITPEEFVRMQDEFLKAGR